MADAVQVCMGADEGELWPEIKRSTISARQSELSLTHDHYRLPSFVA